MLFSLQAVRTFLSTFTLYFMGVQYHFDALYVRGGEYT